MSPKSPLRLALYALVALYLVGDLLIFKGPLRWRIDLIDPNSEASIAHAKAQGVVARVKERPIFRSQLDRAVSEQLWLRGQTAASLSPSALEAVRETALQELIDQELLRAQSAALAPQLAVSDEEIHERVRLLVGRFETKGAMETAMKSQGIPSEKALRQRLASQIRQEKFMTLRIGAAARVTEDEAKAWFEKNNESIANPERIEARHIFIPTLSNPPDEAKEKLETALTSLTEKQKDFATLAKELSEDPASRENGGSLGWMTRDRLPADLAAPLFAMELNLPQLVRTRLGWHLIEVTVRRPAEPRMFEQAKPEIIAALEVVARREAVAEIRRALRSSQAANIRILSRPVNSSH